MPPQPPARAAEGEVGHGGKTALVGAQRQQQVRHAVSARQVALGDAHAVALHAPAAGPHQERAGRSDQPRPERAALKRQSGAGAQLARLVTEEISQQPERAPLRGVADRGIASRRPQHAGAAGGVERRDRPREGQRRHRHHRQDRRQQREDRRRHHERHLVGHGAQRPHPVGPAQVGLADAAAPVHAGQLGQLARGRRARQRGVHQPPAMGRRRMTSSASRGSSRTAVAVPSPSLATAR